MPFWMHVKLICTYQWIIPNIQPLLQKKSSFFSPYTHYHAWEMCIIQYSTLNAEEMHSTATAYAIAILVHLHKTLILIAVQTGWSLPAIQECEHKDMVILIENFMCLTVTQAKLRAVRRIHIFYKVVYYHGQKWSIYFQKIFCKLPFIL